MKLSIVIVSYNTKNLTVACIKSVAKKTKNLKYEIIVVDNGSTDGSVEEIKKSIRGIESIKGIKSKLIENKRNLGFSRANNQGIRAAKGKYILLLNSDTKITKDAIEKLVKFARVTPDAGVVGPKLLNKDKTVQGSVFRLPTLMRAIRQYWLGEKGLLDKYVPGGNEPVAVEALVMAAFLITPKARKLAGLLDEKYFMYFEDLDYCKRVHQSGLKVYFFPEAEVVHHHGASPEPEQVQFRVNGKENHKETKWNYLKSSSKVYHGVLRHFLLNFIIWSGEKWKNFSRS